MSLCNVFQSCLKGFQVDADPAIAPDNRQSRQKPWLAPRVPLDEYKLGEYERLDGEDRIIEDTEFVGDSTVLAFSELLSRSLILDLHIQVQYTHTIFIDLNIARDSLFSHN